MKKLAQILKVLAPVGIILLLEYVLFKANFLPDTWLIGWDSTQPELNFKAHLLRDLQAVWQEYRGLGVLDGMAHGANILHVVYTWLMSLILAPNLIRYVFVFLMHSLGGLGVFYLVKYLFKAKSEIVKTSSSLAAAVFYLFNPGTIQMFYAPFEIFIVHFASLPWLILALIRYLNSKSKKDLMLFFIVNLLATPQFHVPTMFIVYALSVAAFLIFYLLQDRARNLKSMITVAIVLIGINAFWGLPYIYSSLKNAEVITSSKINQLSNDEIVLRNEAFGGLKDVALLYGFNLDYEDWQADSEFDYQFKTWRENWFQREVELIGLTLFLASIAGIFLAVFQKKRYLYPFIFLFLISFINLGSRIPIISFIRNLIWTYVPYYEEIFRFAFTKYIILLALSMAVFLGFILERISSIRKIGFISIMLSFAVVGAVIWGNLPAFKGDFLYDKLKLKVPQEYFDVFEFFNDPELEGRIAILPQPSLWGWEFNSWGYRGSGFIWQGIDNPVLHRSFDPWSADNEGYYLELSDALYNGNPEDVERVLRKYSVEWIVIDRHILQPGGWPEALLLDEIEELLKQSNNADLVQNYGEISIYQTNFGIPSKSFVSAPGAYTLVQNDTNYLRDDQIYQKHGDYISGHGLVYPFNHLLSDRPAKISFADNNLVVEGEIEDGAYIMEIPNWLDEEEYVPTDIYALYQGGNQIKFRFSSLYPNIIVDGVNVSDPIEEEFIVKLDRANSDKLIVAIGGKSFFILQKGETEQHLGFHLLSYSEEVSLSIYDANPRQVSDLTSALGEEKVRECWAREGVESLTTKTGDIGEITLTSVDATACLGTKLPLVFDNKSSILASISFEHRSDTETPPDTCLVKIGQEGCINDSAYFRYGASMSESAIKEYYEVEKGSEYFFDLSARGSDLPGERSSITYRNINLETFGLIGKVHISVDEKFTPQAKNIDFDSVSQVKLEIPLGNKMSSVRREIWDNRRGKISAKNCDLFLRGSVKKVALSSGSVYQASDKAANCDYFVYQDFSKGLGYLLRFVGDNKSGRSLKFFLNNHFSRRNDLEYLLSDGRFDEGYVVLPREDDNGKYGLTIETRSFGSEVGENALNEIEIMPIALKFISSIKLIPANDISFNNDLMVFSVIKSGVSSYFAVVSADSANTVLVLNQGYGGGWQAFDLGKTSSDFERYIPWFFGKKLTHFKVNSWANGWSIPKGQHDIVIVYWPQYLGYFGFGLLVITIISLLFTKDKVLTRSR